MAIDEPSRDKGNSERPPAWVQATRYSYIGLFFGCAVFIGFLGGGWLDRRFHTDPWLMMLGVLLGIAAGFKELIRVATGYRKDLKKELASDEVAEKEANKKNPS